jgi:hypothetical protein
MPTCAMCPRSFTFLPSSPRKRFCKPACRRAFAKTPEGRERNRKALAKYRATARGKAVRNKCNRDWQKTEKGRVCNRRGRKTYYTKKKAAGLCTNPGCHRKQWGNRVRCRKCQQAFRQWYGAWVKTEDGKAAIRASNRARYLKKKAAGLCTHFGCTNPSEGKTYCPQCAARRNAADRAQRAKA